MFMHRQTDGHTCTCIDSKLKDSLFKTCIIMYRDKVRNKHARAWSGIHERVIRAVVGFQKVVRPLNTVGVHRVPTARGGGGKRTRGGLTSLW